MAKDPRDWTLRDVVEAEDRGEELPAEVQREWEAAQRAIAHMGRHLHDEFETLRASLQEAGKGAKRLSDWLESGDPAADYVIAFMSSFSDEERIAALRRILDRVGPRPSIQKWNTNREVFRAALADLGTDVHGRKYTRERFAEQSGFLAVRETIEDLSPKEIRVLSDMVEARFRRVLDRWIRDGLLPGYDWKKNRRREVSDAVLDYAQQEIALNDGPSRLEEAELLAILTEYEEQVFTLDREGYSDREIADRLNTSETAISSALSRVRAKIESALKFTD